MDFYKQKKNAYQDISDMISKHLDIDCDVVVFRIASKYGFGRKFVVDRLNALKGMNIIMFDGTKIKSIERIEPEE